VEERVTTRRPLLLLLLVQVVLLPALAFAQNGDDGVQIQRGLGDPGMALLQPMKEYLSGRAWMMAEGIDPGLRQRPGSDTLTRLDWRSIGGPTATMTPSTQAAGGFLVPFRSPAPAFSRNILISRDFSGSPLQTEPTIAVNPNDPDHLIVGMIDYNFPSNSSYVSYDGGQTWEGPFHIGYLPDDRVSGGDPVVAFDRDGNAYMTSISIGIEEFTIVPVNTATEVSSMAVSRSTDGGYSWPLITSADRSGVSISDQQVDPQGRLRGTVAAGFLDKPWITIGPHPDDPEREIIYVAYVNFIMYYDIVYMGELPVLLPREMSSVIQVVSSEDRAQTWSDPVNVSPTVRRAFGEIAGGGLPGVVGTDRVVQGARPIVDGNGNLYVAWIDSTDDDSFEGLGEINVAISRDAGNTFSDPSIAVVFNEIPFTPRDASFRYWASSFPKMVVGDDGDIYITYTARPPEKPRDDGDIFFVRSLDAGENWSQPVKVNDDEGDALQFFPEMVRSSDGAIHIMWADMRDDPIQTRYHIYYTTTTDGGNTFGFDSDDLGFRTVDTRVTDFPTNPNRAFPYGLFIGDYFGMAATEDEVYMVWPDARLAEFGGINQKIAFARQRAIRTPDIFVSPSAGPGGQNVTVQGFDFQPSMLVQIQLQDSIIATARTNMEGRFTASVFVPVTGEGPQTINVFDESGNFASSSYYTEFGFDNIQQTFGDVLDAIRRLNDRFDQEEGSE
jgi:hypothetical protein